MTTLKEKSYIKRTFSHYLSPTVMEQVLADPKKLALGGEKKEVTVLFSDIRGFTSISEVLAPDETVGLLNEYLSEMTNIIFKHKGTVDKFIGDAIMAFWGAPIEQKDHAERASRCALEMIKKLEILKTKWQKENKKTFNIGIGVNTGHAIIGNMGSKERMDYTAIGDTVNLASRIENLTKEFKTKILVGEKTYEAIKNIAEVKDLGTVKVKGKEQEVKVFELIDMHTYEP